MTSTVPFLARYLLFLLCLTAAAVNTGNNLLYLVLSLMAAFAALAFAAAGRSLRKLQAGLALPDEVAAGQSFILGVEVRSGDARFPTGRAEAALVEFPGDAPRVSLPSLPPGGRAVVSISARAEKRGLYSGMGLRLSTTYPFGLFRRRRSTATSASLVVTPRRRRLRTMTFEAPASAGSDASRRLGDGADLFNIRDYTTQDDARRIDWKASARLDRPMLKEFEREQERAIEIVLDERAHGPEWRRGFEDLVEKAASILDYCEEKGIHGRLIVAEAAGAARSLSGRSAMTYLAMVQARPEAPGPGGAAATAGVPRIVLSLDPEVRTRIHLEPYDSRSDSGESHASRRRAGDASRSAAARRAGSRERP